MYRLIICCSEDCLPGEGDIEGIGDSLPEFEVLGFEGNKQAYYIRCPECVRRFKAPKDPLERCWVNGWNDELKEADKKLNQKEGEVDFDDGVMEIVPPTSVKMEISPSSITTEAEEFLDEAVTRSLQVGGREIIIID